MFPINHDHYDTVIQAVTDEDPPQHINVPLSAVHVLRPIGDRSASLSDKFELLYYTAGLPARPRRAIVALDDIARALGWHATDARNEPMADAFWNRPFHAQRRRGQVIPSPTAAMAGDPTISAITDAIRFEHLTIRLTDIRVLRHIGDRSPSLHAMGWLEVLFVAGFPARPFRALLNIDQLANGLGWYAGYSHNLPIAEAFDHVALYPERGEALRRSRPATIQAAITALLVPAPATFARAGFMARVRAMEEERRRRAASTVH
jgi:hypothetical protein